MFKQLLLTIILTTTTSLLTVKAASAQEIVINGNGSTSANEVNITSQNASTVQQNNASNISNDLKTNVVTGENTANGNTGDNTVVETGNASVATDIKNTTNSSQASLEDCHTDSGALTISDNGHNSVNKINFTNNTNNAIFVNQQSSLTNEVKGNILTGENKLNNNSGNISVQTGNIYAKNKVYNDVNFSQVNLGVNGNGVYSLNITNNGSDSKNMVKVQENKSNILNLSNTSRIFNNSIWNLITGKNTANSNKGNVNIKTGDIALDTFIENIANRNLAEITCACEKGGVTPENPQNPSNGGGSEHPATTVTNNNGTGGIGQEQKTAGKVLAAAVGATLPVTGSLWFILALFINSILLVLGTFIRVKSGKLADLPFLFKYYTSVYIR